MKNYLGLLFLLLIEFSFAQGIAYQATVLNPETQLPGSNSDLIPLANASICMEFIIVDDSNAIEYTERHQTNTSDYGRVDLIIGAGQSNGSFSNINWNGSKKSLFVRIDYGGNCLNFEDFSQSEFNYVPYALYALNTINSVDFSTNSTDDLSEGTNNLYYSDARAQAAISGGTGVTVANGVISIGQSVNTTDDVAFNSVTSNLTGNVTGNLTGNVIGTVSDLSNHTTDNLAEGTNNLYYSDARVQAAFAAGTGVSLTGGTFSIGQSVNTTDDVKFNTVTSNLTGNVTGNLTGNVVGTVSDLSNHDTDNLTEGTTNKYFTDARAKAAISGGTGVTVSNGVVSIGQSVNTTDDVSFNKVTSNVTGNLTGNVVGTVSDLSNHTTDNLAEGNTNKYFTDARAKAAISGGTGVTVTNGEVSIGQSVNTTDDVSFNKVTSNVTGNLTGNVVGTVSDLSNHDTDDLVEGTTNKYFTDARAQAAISGGTGVTVTNGEVSIGQSVNTTDDVSFNKVTSNVTGNLTGNVVGTVSDLSNHDTDDLVEGTTNKYFTDARAQAAISGGTGVTVTNGEVSIGQSVNTTDDVSFNKVTSNVTGNLTGNVVGTVSDLSNHDTDDLVEGTTNKYFTDARAKAAISGGTGVDVTNGVVSIDQAVGTTDAVTFVTVNANLTGNVTGNVVGTVTGTVSSLSNHNTDNLSEGATNLYYTDDRVFSALTAGTGVGVSSGTISIGQAVEPTSTVTFTTVNANLIGNVTGNVSGTVTGTVSDLSNHNTDNLAEGATNKYFTDARAQAAITGGTGVGVVSGTVSIGQAVSTTDSVTFDTVSANIQTNSLQLNGTAVTASATELNLLDGATSSGINSKGSLGLFTGVYSTTIAGASSTTFPYSTILSGGETPSSSSMIIFFSNTEGLIVSNCILTDSNLDTVNDSFKVNFTGNFTGPVVLSYYIAL